jgi:hypothetical protein
MIDKKKRERNDRKRPLLLCAHQAFLIDDWEGRGSRRRKGRMKKKEMKVTKSVL